jgi:hypothetical protein
MARWLHFQVHPEELNFGVSEYFVCNLAEPTEELKEFNTNDDRFAGDLAIRLRLAADDSESTK